MLVRGHVSGDWQPWLLNHSLLPPRPLNSFFQLPQEAGSYLAVSARKAQSGCACQQLGLRAWEHL